MDMLLVSFFATNLAHGYLVNHHRGKHRPTLSERAVGSKQSLLIYRLAHVIGGLAFAVFAYKLFYTTPVGRLLFWLAILGVIAELLQAIIPAKGRYKSAHTYLAFGMSLLMVALGVAALTTLPLASSVRLTLAVIELMILAGYPLAAILPYDYFWIIQMTNINLFYLQMYILVVAK